MKVANSVLGHWGWLIVILLGLLLATECYNGTREDISVSTQSSRVYDRLQSIKAGIYAYTIDWERYPATYRDLTTPISYFRSLKGIADPFSREQRPLRFRHGKRQTIVWSCGPDGDYDVTPSLLESHYENKTTHTEIILRNAEYDSSNGIYSSGDILGMR